MKDGSYVALALVLCSVVVPSCSALDGFSFDGTAGRTVDGTGIKRRENRTLCKAVWFFMEWNSTFSVLERRAEQLRDIFGDIANNMANNEKIAALLSGVISAKANITSALDNAKAAQAANNLFYESIFRDFYIAFESIKWRTDQFSLGHRNVIRGGMRVTEAWLTARELRTDFTPCRVGYNSDPANINGRGGGSSDEADDGGETDDYEWLDEELSEMEDKDDPNEDGSHDKPLYAPDATTIVTNWNSKDLEGNKTHLWDNVMRDTRSAIKAMCVSTTEVPSRQRPVPTQNMWLQGTINMTDIFRQDCQFFNGTQTNETRREEACYNLKQNVHVASKGTANIDFPPTNSRIGQALVRNLTVYGCPDYAGAYKALLSKMTDTVNCTNSTGWDTLESGSITPHGEPTCDEKKTAVEWLEFRFRTALDFMKQQLHGALTGTEAAETRLGGAVTAFNDKRASFCAAMKSLNDAAKAIDELEEQNRHWEADMGKSIAKYNEALKNASSSVEKIKAVESVNESMKDSSVGTIFSGKPAVAYAEDTNAAFQCVREIKVAMSKPDSIAELIKESTGALRSYRETLKALQAKFNAVHGGTSESSTPQSSFLNCDDKPVPTLSLAQAADIVQVLSALGNLQIDNMEDPKNKIEQHQERTRKQMSEIIGLVSAAVNKAVECAAKAESVEKATVEKAKNSLSNGLKRQMRELCATVEQLQKDKEHAVRLMSRTSRMNESAAEYQRRAADAHKEVAQAGARVSGAMSAAARAHEAYGTVRDGASALSEKASRLLSEAARATSEADAQAKRIRDALADVVRNVTNACASTADCADVCAGQATYEIKEPLKDALASILSLNALRNVSALPSTLEAMEAEAERIRKLRDDVKRRAMAVVAAARNATDVEGDHTCMPLFVQLLRALH